MTAPLDRRAVAARILRDRGDALIVTGLGNPTYDVAAAGDTPLNFYFWGAMGGAAMAGLGLALAQPRRRVLVVTGDGEMLMGLGWLRDHRRRAAVEPRHRSARQRALRRDGHAGRAYRARVDAGRASGRRAMAGIAAARVRP